MRYRVLSPWTIAVWAVVIVLVGVGVAVWLLLAYTGGDADANRVQLDAIRTAGTIVVGTGGAAALLLAARRQRTAEIALKQKDRDQALQERVAAATETDAAARRITDLYTKAVEQLGSEKAPVRLGGLYALERLAQDHVEQRQTIVNVLCAYLRMPYTLPGDPPADDADNGLITAHRERVQEREVRLAAQRILAHHLRPWDDPDNQDETFWAGIDLDLTGATLIDLDLTSCAMREARFDRAMFTGNARFNRAMFTGNAWFNQASFTGDAWFDRATFTRDVWFNEASFTGDVGFDRAMFTGMAQFVQATFTGNAGFDGATFTRDVWFNEASFTGGAGFGRAMFTGMAQFVQATFTGNADFIQASFTSSTGFDRATLPSTRYAGRDTRSPWTDFVGARFARDAPPEVAPFVSPPNEETGDEASG